MIDFDVETTGLQPYSGKNEAFLWIFSDGEVHEAIPFLPSKWNETTGGVKTPQADGSKPWRNTSDYSIFEAHARIQWWFDRAAAIGVGPMPNGGSRAWNAKFDRAFADQAGCFNVPGDGWWYDGMLDAQAIDERRSVALKNVAVKLFGEGAAGPQTEVKDWLNAENSRRASLLTDADKARVGKLRIKYVEAKCTECGGKWQAPTSDVLGPTCPHCSHTHHFETDPFDCKNRTRPATQEECDLAIEQAEAMTDQEGTYTRANYSDVPDWIMHPYGVEDVVLTRKVAAVHDAVIAQNPDLAKVCEFERKAMDALYAVERRGLPALQSEYRRLEQEVIANLETLERRVMDLAREGDPVVYAKRLAGKNWAEDKEWVEQDETGKVTSYRGGAAQLSRFNPKSSAQVLAAIEARGADMSFMAKTDGVPSSADAENLRAVDDELAEAILEFRSEFRVLSTYVRPMIGRSYVSSMNVYKEPFIAPDSRIHATYRQVGARTGRMSCADPNMQNQPRDDLRLRYNIVADPGFKFVACDLANIEMVLFAAYCGEGRLLDAVRNGDDLHILTAKMLGFRDRKRSGGGYESARQQGKVYNFTTIYGGGLRSIMRYFRCSMQEARLYKQRYAKAYPEVGRLSTRIEFRLVDDGYIQDKLISGRRFRVDPRDAYKATNYLVQGTAAALLKDAMISLHADGVPMVALVHDEILAHVPEDEAQDVADLIVKRMTQAAAPGGPLWLPASVETVADPDNPGQLIEREVPAHPVVPLRADAEIVDRWSDAKRLKDDEGREYLFTPDWAGGEKRYVEAA